MNEKFIYALRACAANGKRLLDEVELLEFEAPPSTQYFLSMIAQEEFAKAFLFYLVAVGVVPWSRFILRAALDHKCKQLLCIVMDFLSPSLEEFIRRINAASYQDIPLDIPPRVADAINILRHEKIGRWKSKTWVWAEDPKWNEEALEIAEGKLDQQKQDSLYVRVIKTGVLKSTPKKMNPELAKKEFERGKRFGQLIEDLTNLKRPVGIEYEKVENSFRALFSEKSL
jgi:hypothetical protein